MKQGKHILPFATIRDCIVLAAIEFLAKLCNGVRVAPSFRLNANETSTSKYGATR